MGGYAGTMKGRVRTYIRTVAQGEAFTLSQFMRWADLRSDEDRARALAAINQVKRDGEIDPDSEILMVCLEPGQLWRQTNAPTPKHEGAPYGPEDIREVVAELEDDEAPPAGHVCAYEVVGLDGNGQTILRDSELRLYRLTAI